MMAESVPSGWYQDPTGQGDGRYWNGASWTDSVSRAGLTVSAPIDPTQAQTPPVPGSALTTPTPAPAAQTVVVKQKSSPVGAIVAALITALVVIGIIFAVSNSDSDDDTETDTTEAPEAPPATDG